MTRHRLPPRRHMVTDCAFWPPQDNPAGKPSARIHVSGGFDEPGGRILECFLRGGGRTGTDIDFVLDDFAVVLSLALQSGIGVDQVAKSLARDPGGGPTCVLGAVVDCLVRIERGEGG